MRLPATILSALISVTQVCLHAEDFRTTIPTGQDDKIILRYSVTLDNGKIVLGISDNPVIIPSDDLEKACRGRTDRLKIVIFDRIGNFNGVRWGGMTPSAFMIPAALDYSQTEDGFYILEQTISIEFKRENGNAASIDFPVFIALEEKKNSYRIIRSGTEKLRIDIPEYSPAPTGSNIPEQISVRPASGTENSASEENDSDIINALGSIDIVRQILEDTDRLPFPQTLQLEIYNLRSIKGRIADKEITDQINRVLLEYTEKEEELQRRQDEMALAAETERQELILQQAEEAKARQAEAEEKLRQQEEKQQKRTLRMVIGGGALAVLCFIGNAIFKHFGNIRNQRSIMEMQQALTRQAEHEARRRGREVIRNKAHNIANRGKEEIRKKVKDSGKSNRTQSRKSI